MALKSNLTLGQYGTLSNPIKTSFTDTYSGKLNLLAGQAWGARLQQSANRTNAEAAMSTFNSQYKRLTVKEQIDALQKPFKDAITSAENRDKLYRDILGSYDKNKPNDENRVFADLASAGFQVGSRPDAQGNLRGTVNYEGSAQAIADAQLGLAYLDYGKIEDQFVNIATGQVDPNAMAQYNSIYSQLYDNTGELAAQAFESEYNALQIKQGQERAAFESTEAAKYNSAVAFQSGPLYSVGPGYSTSPGAGTISQFIMGEVSQILQAKAGASVSVSSQFGNTLAAPTQAPDPSIPSLPGFSAAQQPTLEEYRSAAKIASGTFTARNAQVKSLLEEAISKQGKY